MTTGSARTAWRRLALAALLPLAAVACGDDGATPSGSDAAPEIRGAFSAGGSIALAVYLEVDNPGKADAIVGASVSGEGFDGTETVSLHRTEHQGDLALMISTKKIDLPAATEGALLPSMAHVMVEDVSSSWAPGDSFTVTLQLASGVERTAPVQVLTPDEVIGRQVGDHSSHHETGTP